MGSMTWPQSFQTLEKREGQGQRGTKAKTVMEGEQRGDNKKDTGTMTQEGKVGRGF